jgi:2-keto-3-deoxy-L-fuconate dehydrogenase
LNTFDLSGKTAIVTGGASGIGKAISKMFAAHGALVHIVDLDPAASASLASEIAAQGRTATGHTCDVASLTEVEKLVQSIGAVDILVNNAGIAQIGTLESTSSADFQRIFDVNVKGYFHCMQACLPSMKARKRGVILNLASIAAMVGLSSRFGYSMSKGAILAMTYSVAKDYLDDNIRCNAISPARIHTPFVDAYVAKNYPGKEVEMMETLSRAQPIGRMGEPDEVAALALYLCSDEASFVTGANYPLDGGTIHLSV